jgi:hypothetical protein
MAGYDVKAYNVDTAGFSAGLVGPSRSRIKNIIVYGTNVTTFTLRNGSGTGDILLDLTVAAGTNNIYLGDDDGILAEDGCYFAALAGVGSIVTLILG